MDFFRNRTFFFPVFIPSLSVCLLILIIFLLRVLQHSLLDRLLILVKKNYQRGDLSCRLTLLFIVDTIKTRLQTRHDYTPISDVPPKEPSKLESIVSLYRGIGITLLFSVPALTLYLTTYEWAKTWLDLTPLLTHALAGVLAELAAGLFFTPMEVIKSQLQMDPIHTTTTLSLAKSIARQEGPLGFYKGYWITIAVFLPHTVTYFVVYEQLKSCWSTEQQTFWVFLMCSAIASALGITLSTPLDIVKTRWQVSARDVSYRGGPWMIIQHMWHEEGQWRAFTKGMLVRIAWGIPVTTINMAVFEQLIKLHNS